MKTTVILVTFAIIIIFYIMPKIIIFIFKTVLKHRKQKLKVLQRSTLQKNEVDLITQLEFDQNLILKLKQYAGGPIEHLPKVNSEDITYENEGEFVDGLFLPYSLHSGKFISTSNYDFIALKQELLSSNYLIFKNKSYRYGEGIAVLKGTEQWDILRYRKTFADDISTEDIIKQLKYWNVAEIIGVDFDKVEIDFGYYHHDIKQLAHEIYEFCPDIIVQGLGTLEQLEEYLDVRTDLTLWWD